MKELSEQLPDWTIKNGLEALAIILIAAVLYYVGAIALGYLVKRAVRGTRGRKWHAKDVDKRQKTLSALFKNMWRISIVIMTIVALLMTFFKDISFAPLFASAGIIGVAIGFGSQALVKDFLSGIFIISENQYRVGDIIDIEGHSGTVERIGVRSTVLRDADGNVHYFPNGIIQHVVNKTMGYSMARFSVLIDPSSDIDMVTETINAIGAELATEDAWKRKIITPPAFVSVGEFTTASVSLLISGKTQPSDQWSVTSEMRRRLLEAFEEKNITLGTTPLPAATDKK